MRLKDILLEKKKVKGTYVAVKFTSDTVARLKKFVNDLDIPNPLNAADYHTTVIYSRVYVPEIKLNGKVDPKMIGKPTKFEIFDTQDGKRALVLLYDCPELTKKHEHIMDTTDATYDYDKYKAHITLSYDIKDKKESELNHIDVSKVGDIIINKIYTEELDLDWADDKVDSD